jgi:hypothetical protein
MPLIELLQDFQFWIASLLTIECALGFIMFLNEWRVYGKASELFVCITALFGCLSYATLMSVFSRIVWYFEIGSYGEFQHSHLVDFRWVPLLVCITIIMIISAKRAHGKNTILAHLRHRFFGRPLPYPRPHFREAEPKVHFHSRETDKGEK